MFWIEHSSCFKDSGHWHAKYSSRNILVLYRENKFLESKNYFIFPLDNLLAPTKQVIGPPEIFVEYSFICTMLLDFMSMHTVHFSHSVLSNSLRPHRLQHTSFPVCHQLLELAQTHVHQVGDAIQLSHLLLSPFPPAFNFSQHQSLFKWVSSSHQVTKVLKLQLQHQSFQLIFRTDFL